MHKFIAAGFLRKCNTVNRCLIPAAIATAHTASTMKASSGWNVN